jgi:hypothetical protein
VAVLNELLLRFRNAGVPGAAGAPAVPAEPLDAERAAEGALHTLREERVATRWARERADGSG